MNVIGLMSGTSMDAVDAALVEIRGTSQRLRVKFRGLRSEAYPPLLRRRLLAGDLDGEVITRLNYEVGEIFSRAALKLCRRLRVPLSRVDLIGSHGQTLVHLGRCGTLQIGEPAVIAARTGVPTIANFRAADIAAGGVGAPLTPYVNYLLFRHPKRDVCVHNLGGISNVTLIPRGAGPNRLVGFDTGPANMVIDGLVRLASHGPRSSGRKNYDPGGRGAGRGWISLPLLREMRRHPFLRLSPPKSTGRGDFGPEYLQWLVRQARRYRLREVDLLATATAFTADSIASHYRRFILTRARPTEVIFAGGGVRNTTLMKMIAQELPGIKMTTSETRGIPPQALEAVSFAVLAYLSLRKEPVDLRSVTGARHPVILGTLTPGKSPQPPFSKGETRAPLKTHFLGLSS